MGRFVVRSLFISALVAVTLSADALSGEPAIRLPMTPVETGPGSVVVRAGDHLWKISAGELRDTIGRDVTDAEIWPYWREVIAANLENIRSGDPDLIYPGEVIRLPASGSP